MTRAFVLLSTQRSGSTWVIDMLNSHPFIVAYSELLLEGAKGKPEWGGEKDLPFWNEFFDAERVRRPGMARREFLFEYVDAVYGPRPGCSAIGFKLMYGQLGAFPELRDYLCRRHVTIIHLIRRNPIDILLSKEIAVHRDVFHSRGEEPLAAMKVSLNLGELVGRLEAQQAEVERARKKLSDTDLPYMEVIYEDLISEEEQFERILGFLGVTPRRTPLQSSLQKLNTAPHRAVIANYKEVAQILHRTHFEQFLR